MKNIIDNTPGLIEHVSHRLHEQLNYDSIAQGNMSTLAGSSAVLFLLGLLPSEHGMTPESCLILNKRSEDVRQAGDLCCPGGGISLPLDNYISKLLHLPGSPLKRWPSWPAWKKQFSSKSKMLALLLSTCLRESYEEMRLNPLKVTFLGSLPINQLASSSRRIYPLAGWVSDQTRFLPNWEVEKIITIPLCNFFKTENYARIRFTVETPNKNLSDFHMNDYPCYIHKQGDSTEILWGATFRITMNFLEIVFGFNPPDMDSLPTLNGFLSKNYYEGNRNKN